MIFNGSSGCWSCTCASRSKSAKGKEKEKFAMGEKIMTKTTELISGTRNRNHSSSLGFAAGGKLESNFLITQHSVNRDASQTTECRDCENTVPSPRREFSSNDARELLQSPETLLHRRTPSTTSA